MGGLDCQGCELVSAVTSSGSTHLEGLVLSCAVKWGSQRSHGWSFVSDQTWSPGLWEMEFLWVPSLTGRGENGSWSHSHVKAPLPETQRVCHGQRNEV